MADGTRAPGRSGRRTEAGAATVLVLAMAGLLLTVGLAAVAVGGVFVAARRAQAAADLAALAAAAAARDGQSACAVAGSVALANGARLDRCRQSGPDVLVTVSVSGPAFAGRHPRLVGRARAGPR